MPRKKKRKTGLREDGRYQKNFRYMGKQYAVYGNTEDEVFANKKAKLEELKSEKENHDNPTLNDYYKTFTDFRQNKVKESTLRSQDIQFRTCASISITEHMTLGEMRIQEIRPQDCKLVQKALENSGRSTVTVNNCMDHLSHVFNTAVKDEIINRNPCRALERVRRTEPPARETKHRALSVEETERFFTEAEKSYYLNALKLMLQTGMRIGEVGALRAADIDSFNNCIHVNKTITRDVLGGYMIGDTPKTDAGNRDIPLNDTLKQIIKDQKEWNRLIFGNVAHFDGLLFKSPEGQFLREYCVNRDIARITKRAGIDRFTCHALRATFATRFIEQRPQDYKVLSEILGHSNTKITLDLYTHVMKTTKINAMNGISIAM